MKKYLILLLSISTLISCEPKDFPNEGIDLPEMEFGLKISPDTAYIRLGDTVTLAASIPSTLSNGVKIEDGKATIDLFMSYRTEVPATNVNNETVVVGTHLNVLEEKGSIRVSPNTGKIVEIYAHPYGDSIQVAIKFIPLKKGTFRFSVQSMFYEGSKGKTRTVPKFDVENPHWDQLWKIEGHPAPSAKESSYYRNYFFAVTD